MAQFESRHRFEVYEKEKAADKATAESIRGEVLDFIKGKSGETFCAMITFRKNGSPMARPVSTFIYDGWHVGTISQGEHVKNQHVRNNPIVAYQWVELNSQSGVRLRSVFLQGRCELISDPATVQEFFRLRQAETGQGDAHPEDDWQRLLMRVTPEVVRAEGFLGPLTPAIYRTFE
jgi:nitroimidazol reductase NimA-like FMN-containing flavoprotein (pyridoxamine 5'-phosphate oxidase superfamily)